MARGVDHVEGHQVEDEHQEDSLMPEHRLVGGVVVGSRGRGARQGEVQECLPLLLGPGDGVQLG